MSAPAPLPPLNIEIEQAILGALMIDESHFWRLEGELVAEDFYDPLHARIFEEIRRRYDVKLGVTPLTIAAALKSDPGLVEVGGLAYLANVCGATPAMPRVKDLARELRGLALRRRLMGIAQNLYAAALGRPDGEYGEADSDWPAAPEAIADHAGNQLYEAAKRAEHGRGAIAIKDLAYEAICAAETARNNPGQACLTTGFSTVDFELGGLMRGDLVVLGAPPNMGKMLF